MECRLVGGRHYKEDSRTEWFLREGVGLTKEEAMYGKETYGGQDRLVVSKKDEENSQCGEKAPDTIHLSVSQFLCSLRYVTFMC